MRLLTWDAYRWQTPEALHVFWLAKTAVGANRVRCSIKKLGGTRRSAEVVAGRPLVPRGVSSSRGNTATWSNAAISSSKKDSWSTSSPACSLYACSRTVSAVVILGNRCGDACDRLTRVRSMNHTWQMPANAMQCLRQLLSGIMPAAPESSTGRCTVVIDLRPTAAKAMSTPPIYNHIILAKPPKKRQMWDGSSTTRDVGSSSGLLRLKYHKSTKS